MSATELSKNTSVSLVLPESTINKKNFIKAADVVYAHMTGAVVSKDILKTAHQVLGLQGRLLSAENNKRSISLNEGKFKYQIIKDYGLPENKREKAKLIKLVAPNLQLSPKKK